MAHVNSTWICGAADTVSLAHLARHGVLRGAVTGRAMSRYSVTACLGRSIGGAYGPSAVSDPDARGLIKCPRCLRLGNRVAAAFARAMAGAPSPRPRSLAVPVKKSPIPLTPERLASIARRLWARVDKIGGSAPGHQPELGPCWPWIGRVANTGYGRIRIGGGNSPEVNAHRAAHAVATGADPGALLVLHRCDVPLCCRPDHLFLGTDADNSADMIRKGRRRSGTPLKVTDEEILEMRALYQAGGTTYRALAGRYGISEPYAEKLVTGRHNRSHDPRRPS